MSGDTKVYDSEAVDCIAVTIPITDGKADTFVKVTPKGPAFDTEAGCDGEVTRFATHERRCMIEIGLKRSSRHNAELAAVHAADRESTGGAGIGGFLLKDNNGSTLIACDRAWIVQLPDWEMGKAVGDVTWQLEAVVSPLAALPGGN